MTYKLPSSSCFGARLVCGVLAAFCLCALLAQPASAQTYVNDHQEYYKIPDGPFVPNIDATAFVNKSIFSVSYNTFNNNQIQMVEPWIGTYFFTNTGTMMVNAPLPTNSLFLDGFTSGVGYQFDTEQGNSNVMAGTFFNPGTVRCNSIIDGNNPFGNFFAFDGIQFIEIDSIGSCFVSATNIINPGNIVVGSGGEMNLNGQNVNLARSVLTLEQGVVSSNNVDVAINTEGEGVNTNGYVPFFSLTATNAQSSFPDNLQLSFPTAYFNVTPTSPSNQIVRAVFIVNANTNVQASVYVAPQAFFNEGAMIQWAGTFQDPATGLTDTNYLYLFHYFPGSFGLTNLFPVLSVGTPATPGFISAFSYLWSQQTPFPNLGSPTASGFLDKFNDTVITNTYEFFNASLTGTTIPTNQSSLNPSGALTNLPNQIVINAARELKMDLAQISGANYMSINATNQFDGSPGALIFTPYSDINLAVTNGFPNLTISNLLAANIPEWGGTLNEWSTRWTNTDLSGMNTDFRVMLVYANLTPAISPQVQNLTLTASNLVISDVLNVIGSMQANAQVLNLTTNGGGATSPDGELNLSIAGSAWNWNSTFPYLTLLTNNGAIRMPNLANFISSAPGTNGVATIPAISATSILREAGGANVATGSSVSIGGATYTYSGSISKSSPAYSVLIGSKFDGSLSNLIAAINAANGAGTLYGTNGFFSPNGSVTAGTLLTNLPIPGITNHGFIVTATIPGTTPGNLIPTSSSATNLLWTNSASGLMLAGGVNAILGATNISYFQTNYLAIINNGLISNQGSIIWASNFMNGGVFDNGVGPFELTSWTTTLTNGSLSAGADMTLAADTLAASNLMLQAGTSLTLEITNSFTEGSVSNGNFWVVGTSNATGFNGYGLVLPFLPVNANYVPTINDLLGTSIALQTPPPNKQVENDWAGMDYGANTTGYNTNNMAVGQLILTAASLNSPFYFSGPPGSTTSNAIYVDRLVLQNYASLAAREGSAGIPTLLFNNNNNGGSLTIYYADALSSEFVDGGPLLDVSSILNGLNNGHLVWVPEYVGFFSGTNIENPDGTITRQNIGVVTGGGNARMDSNGNGIPNSGDPNPVFLANQIDFQEIHVGNSNRLTWHSPPGSTNFVLNTTNFVNWNVAATVINPATVPPPAGWPITNVVYQPFSTNSSWYRVRINQNNSILYGQ